MVRIENAAYAVSNEKQCVEFEKRVTNSIARLKPVILSKIDNAITSDRARTKTDTENQPSPQRACLGFIFRQQL